MTGAYPARAGRVACLIRICLTALIALTPARPASAQTSLLNQPTLTADNASTFSRGSGPVIISPGLRVTGGGTITGAQVLIANDLAPGDTLGIQGQSGNNGKIGLFDWSYSSTTGVLTLNGSGTTADIQTALRQVTFHNTNPATNIAPRTIHFSLGSALPNHANGHYYEFVAQPGIGWSAALTATSGRNLFGLQGYLATITDATENHFVANRLVGRGWLGASDDSGQGTSEGNWIWANGPEAGEVFFVEGSGPIGSAYVNWAAGQPDTATSANFAHLLATSQWAAADNSALVDGYLIEYGGLPGDPVLQIDDTTTINMALIAPTLNGLPPITSANATSYLVAGECLTGASVTVRVDSVGTSLPCASGTYSATLNISSIADGPSVLVQVSQSDGSLTSGEASASVPKDTIVGMPTPVTPVPINAANSAAYPISGVCEAAATVAISVEGLGATVTCATVGVYSATLDLRDLPDGDNLLLTLVQTDTVGNTSLPANTSVRKDTLPPLVTIETAGMLRSGTPVISGTAEPAALVTIVIDQDNNPATDSDRITFLVTADDDGIWTLDLATDTPFSGSLAPSGLTPGRTATISASAHDLVGNTGFANSRTVLILPLLYLPSVMRRT